ncbi:MAG TPA: hypothetical protein VNP04_05510 [Alphaproteobacteria bacterium]|nr:hypothetical protein [Alphaproteobacteria bacterium]
MSGGRDRRTAPTMNGGVAAKGEATRWPRLRNQMARVVRAAGSSSTMRISAMI